MEVGAMDQQMGAQEDHPPPPALQDIVASLERIVGHPPNRGQLQGLLHIHEHSASMLEQWLPTNPNLCVLIMQAATRHLPSLLRQETASVPPEAASIVMQATAALTATEQPINVSDVSKVVVLAATSATPRNAIAQTGILPVLAQFIPRDPENCFVKLEVVQADFLELCILAGHYRFARETIRRSWPRPTAASSIEQVLRYYYLRGLVHIGTEEWSIALRCFRTVLSLPGNAVSALAVAAWKRLALVECITSEDTYSAGLTPPGTTTVVSTYITEGCRAELKQGQASSHMVTDAAPEDTSMQPQPGKRPLSYSNVAVYKNICKAFEKSDLPGFKQLVEQQTTLLQTESTLGLVMTVQDALYKRIIVQASRMFAVIPLDDLAKRLDSMSHAQVRTLLLQLSVEKAWNIDISNDQNVVFPAFSSFKESDVNVQELVGLARAVQKTDAQLVATPKYQKSTTPLRKENMKGGGPRGVEDL